MGVVFERSQGLAAGSGSAWLQPHCRGVAARLTEFQGAPSKISAAVAILLYLVKHGMMFHQWHPVQARICAVRRRLWYLCVNTYCQWRHSGECDWWCTFQYQHSSSLLGSSWDRRSLLHGWLLHHNASRHHPRCTTLSCERRARASNTGSSRPCNAFTLLKRCVFPPIHLTPCLLINLLI